jgi:hypothetical protein
MNDAPATPDHTRALVGAVIALCPYRRALAPMVDDIARVALVNDQIRAVLERVAERSRFAATGRVGKGDLGPDRAPLFMFLEYIRFASPSFLASVGEPPPGHPHA